MSLVPKPEWDALMNPALWGTDFAPAEVVAGKGFPCVALKLGIHKGALRYKLGKDKKYDVKDKDGKGLRWEKIGSALEVTQESQLAFPDGTIWTPPGGLTVANLELDKAPADPFWDFEADLPPGSMLAWQPPLTQAEKDGNEASGPATRPDWCVGSAAVFVRGVKYAHLPRPFAVDANGAWTWGTLSAFYVGGQLVIRKSIPAPWLAAAAYPVWVDTTMGYGSIGGTGAGFSPGYIIISGPYAGVGTVTSCSIYAAGGPLSCTMGIYDLADLSLLADTAGGTINGAAWYTQNLDASATLLEGHVYGLGEDHETSMTYYYDAVDWYFDSYKASAYSAGTLPNPAGTSPTYETRKRISFYATYTLAGGGGGLLQANLRGNMQ